MQKKTYKDEVAQYFINEYKRGNTPNPDVLCNQKVKFGAFLDFAKQHGADFVATGHYAQKKEVGKSYALHRGADHNKDQSYFLWTLTQDQLQYILFPVGDTPKDLIRKEAEKAGIPTAQKKDSQGVCFLGHIDIPDFLSNYIKLEEGKVLDTGGNTIGTHSGALVYTIGQRHGFTIDNSDSKREVYYVIEKDIESNVLIVDTTKPTVDTGEALSLTNCNWINTVPEINARVSIQTRYRQTPVGAIVQNVTADSAIIQYENTAEKAAVGQSCVLYTGDSCIGGGIIAK